ncbi:MAG: signal recognition particle-docking protein FtsY, partial [Melioribacteraceae bacterium]
MGLFKKSIFESVKQAFSKTKSNISEKLNEIFVKKKIDAEDLQEIENILLQSDFGIDFTDKLISTLNKRIRSGETVDIDNLKSTVKDIFIEEYKKSVKITSVQKAKPHFVVLLGINGAGKTTTIAKLANYYSNLYKSVIIGSCDTFRAAANEQLNIWATRANVRIVEDFSKDPAAVAFETCKTALENNLDIVLIDTAGRLHTNKNLLDELKKILNVIDKFSNNNAVEVLLVVDGNSGQNAKNQLTEFAKVVNLTGLIITKLDGTARGGSVLQLSLTKNVPIKFLGVGEGI